MQSGGAQVPLQGRLPAWEVALGVPAIQHPALSFWCLERDKGGQERTENFPAPLPERGVGAKDKGIRVSKDESRCQRPLGSGLMALPGPQLAHL